ncbi:MAG: InlB B-repeat-containing protein [Bacilli bacterium]|nr:InlB B-repeat-containing protein [Bacilli bacterium]
MKKVYRVTLKSLLFIVLSFCVFNIISSYAAEPIFKIFGITVKEKSTGVTVNDVDLNNDEIINDVLFSDVNDYIIYDLKIKNTSSEDYTIKSITDNNTSEYLKYTYDNLSNVVVNAGTEKDLSLTITYIKQATDPDLSNTETNLIITYEKVGGGEEQEEITPSVNPDEEDKGGSPKTGDSVIIYFILGGISIIGLVVLSKNKKKNKIIVILGFMLIPLCVYANTLRLSIKFSNNIKTVAYDIEIDLGNGSSIIYKSLAKGAKLTKPEDPTKRGYKFDNWYLNNEVYDFDTVITSPISLEARYTKETYEISYDLDGGSLGSNTNPTEYDVDSDITLFNPSKQGYDFVGWRLNNSTETVLNVNIKDEVGNKSYKAIYTPKTDTPYTVTHKYRHLNDDGFDVVTEENTVGTTGAVIEVDYRVITGFKTPTTDKHLTILADGSAEKVYEYERETYDFVLTDTTNVTSDTVNGNYPYGTVINLTANDIDGYTFTKWSNDVTTNPYQITLTGDVTISPVYTANTNTPYTVKHKYQHIDDDGFDEVVESNTVGTTDTIINVPYQTLDGFIEPTTSQSLKILGDGSAEKVYEYVRETHSFTLNDITNLVTSSVSNNTYRYGKEITLTAGEKTGCTFVKWSNNVTTSTYTFNLTSDVTISPIYTCTVTFNPNNGGSTTSTEVEYGEKVDAPANPSKDGYTFSYWKLNDSQYDFANTTVTGPITLVAEYTANGDTPYTVKHRYQHIDDDGYDEVIEPNTTGTTGDTITVPYQTLEGFVEPTTSQSLTITGDGEATKIYEYERETHSFTLNDITNLVTSSVSNNTYRYGKEITLTAGSKQGCTFVKWSNDETTSTYTFNLTSDVTISPVYTCTVTFDPNNTEGVTYEEVVYGDAVSEPSTDPEKTGYTFNYWTLDNSEYDFTSAVTGPITLTANYSLDTYTITYITDGGTLTGEYPETYDYEHSVNLPTPNKQGYDFDGWMVTGTSVIISPEIPIHSTGNKSFTAHYTPKTNTQYKVIRKYQNLNNDEYTEEAPEIYYGTTDDIIEIEYNTPTGFKDPTTSKSLTILPDGSATKVYEYERQTYLYTFNDNGYNATSSLATGTYKYGTEITLTAGLEDAYSFTNWSNNVTTNPYTFTLTGALTISPVYVTKTYTVSFVTNNGDTIPEQTINHGETATKPSDPSKDYYDFDNWYIGNSEYNFSTPVTSDIELNAIFTPTEYTITYVLDDGELETGVTNPNTYNVESNNITLNNPTKDGYIFTGWTFGSSSVKVMEVTIPTGSHGNRTYTAHYRVDGPLPIICKKALTLDTETCSLSNGGSKGCVASGYQQGDTITYGNIASSDTIQVGDAYLCDVDGTGFNKRFYYLRTIDDKAVLIYSDNTGVGITIPNEPYSYLPTTSTWTNLTASYEDNRVARFISKADLIAAAGTQNITSGGALDHINFLFENTSYAGNGGRSTVWATDENGELKSRYHKDARNYAVIDSSKLNSSENNVRPVIELPLEQLEHDNYIVKFDPHGGTVDNEYQSVVKGTSIGTLPNVTKTDSTFGGWYTTDQYETLIDENTIPDGYNTYHAKWVLDVSNAILNQESFVLVSGGSDQITVSNASLLEPYTFVSNDENVVTVNNNGEITAVGVGTTTISMTGTNSSAVKTINVSVVDDVSDFTLTFVTSGDVELDSNVTTVTPASIDEMYVTMNTAVGGLPQPGSSFNPGYTFDGWYTDTDFVTEVKDGDIITNNMTLYAKWVPTTAVAELNNNKFYTVIQNAVNAAPSTQSTIKILKDNTVNDSTMSINLYTNQVDKNIILDLNGHTIKNTKNYVVRARANLVIKNGTIQCTTTKGAVELNTGSLVLDNVRIEATGKRQALFIENKPSEGGSTTSSLGAPVVEIRGTSYLESNAEWSDTYKRATITILSGTLNIKSGTIVAKNPNKYAIYADNNANVTIGTKDGSAITSTPIIIGETEYGIGTSSNVTINFYDGIIKGITDAIQNQSDVIPDDTHIEDNTQLFNEEDDLGYKVLYLIPLNDDYIIQFKNEEGDETPIATTNVTPGDSITAQYVDSLNPVKAGHVFDCWYSDTTSKTCVNFPVTPVSDTVYYAKWTSQSSDEIVSFNINNEALKSYFSNVDTWVSGATNTNYTAFKSSMSDNFTANSCSACCTGSNCDNINNCDNPTSGNKCDQSIGYDTGITTGITVRISNESTKVKNGAVADYLTVTDEKIYNMIPGVTYYWESNNDSNIYGYVKATGERRTIYTSVRNVRDLGGLATSFERNNTTKTGTINYGRLYRGAKLNTAADVTSLTNLGITREIDLRPDSEQNGAPRLSKYDKSNSNTVTSSTDIVMHNYVIYPDTNMTYYKELRDTIKTVMKDIVNDNSENIFFHCTIGTDRTGTLAYFLEGLLGVSEEDRLEDYELTYYFGLLNRTRFHDNLQNSSYNPRFYTMYNTYKTNEDIYNVYMYGLSGIKNPTASDLNTLTKQQLLDFIDGLGLTGYDSNNTEAELIEAIETQLELEDQLIQNFRDKMITYN